MIMKAQPVCDPLVVAVQSAMDALTVMFGADGLGDAEQARQIVRDEIAAHFSGRHGTAQDLSDRAVLGDIVARSAARLMGKEDLLS